ncbi:MAG: hypothetical protein UR15_C0001G0012 [Parcubacteria group bacterium GW2011_GWA2_31_28]|nr:MAG: hypothetical protein UR15_C0001G0012 [Parcubacteria group bacterium GW2011_GWA2_31_28]
MGRYGLSMKRAEKLQEWALKESGAEKYLKTLPILPEEEKIKPGLYVDYFIDIAELEDDGLDYCTPQIVAIWAVYPNKEEEKIGYIMAYNWETYWLEIGYDCEVDNVQNWWELINEEYNKKLKEGNG